MTPVSKLHRGRSTISIVLGLLVLLHLVVWPWSAEAEASIALDAAALDRLVFVNDGARPAVAVVDSRDDALLGHIELGHIADVMAIARTRGRLVTASCEEPWTARMVGSLNYCH